jgi:hypothetical protein
MPVRQGERAFWCGYRRYCRLPIVFAVLTAGCLDLTTAQGDGGAGGRGSASGGSSSGTSPGGDAGGGSSGGKGATGGTNCTTDPASGITLCEQIDACPGLLVDQGAFPGCGFRMSAASTYDLECACGESLCPVGAPTSCADAAQLLDQAGSSVVVCQELNSGACLPISSPGSGNQGTCDKTCESDCAGEPNCIQLCGC